MNLFNKKQIIYRQKDSLFNIELSLTYDLHITVNKAGRNNINIKHSHLRSSIIPIVINISLLPEIFDLLSKIKVSYLNDMYYVNQTSKFFLNNFNTDYHSVPYVIIKGKKVFSHDERFSMFNQFRHHIGNDKAYKIDDLEKIIGVRIAYLEQYLLETKHPSFTKRSSNELLIDTRTNTSNPPSIANLAAAGGQYGPGSICSTSFVRGAVLIDALVKEIVELCDKYKNESSLSKEVYRVKSTIKHVTDLVNLFNDLSREEQASSSTKLIKILDDVLVNIKAIIKQIEESNVFEFDIQCKFIESIYNE